MKSAIALVLLLFIFSTDAATLYLTRHFEKAAGDDPSLTSQGQSRAEQLATLLADKPISAIYATPYKRTQETVMPLSKATSVEITTYDPKKLKALARTLQKNNETAVIAGHSNTTPELIRYLGGPAFSITEQDYGTLFVLEFVDGQTNVTLQRVPKQ